MAPFKYLKKCYANSLCESGMIRLGTLYEYRDTERYGNNIGDKYEGTGGKQWNLNGETYGGNQLPEKVKQIGRIRVYSSLKGDGSIVFSETCPNFYIYSVCATFFDSVSDFMDPEYDSCVEILNQELFAAIVTKELDLPFLHWSPCKYQNRIKNIFDDGIIDYSVIKETKYVQQNEVRGIWGPIASQEKARILSVPEIAQFCKRKY